MRQLDYFVAVAEEGSFTRGARRLQSVQSAASAAVARLEHEFGQRLFVRGPGTLELTEAGRVLLARARAIQDQTRDARSELDALRGGLAGTLTIGTILAFGSTLLPAALSTFHRRYPAVVIQLRLSAVPIEQHLETLGRRFDLALVPLPEQIPEGVVARRVELVRLGLACPIGHPLSLAHGVRYSDLAAETFIDFPDDWGNRRIVDDLFDDEGCSRNAVIEVTSVAAALTLVAGGLGLSFVPEQFIAEYEGVCAVELRRPPPSIPLGVAIPRHEATPPARALFGMLVELARKSNA